MPSWFDRLTGRATLLLRIEDQAATLREVYAAIPPEHRYGGVSLAKAIRNLSGTLDGERAARDESKAQLAAAHAEMVAHRERADAAERELAVARDSLRTRIPEVQRLQDQQAVAIREQAELIKAHALAIAEKDHVIDQCEQGRQALADELSAERDRANRLQAVLDNRDPKFFVFPGALD